MIPLYDIIQGTPEWFKLRIANPGGAGFKRIVTSTGEPSSSADGYLKELFDEYFLQKKIEKYKSKRMDEGNQNESESLKSYRLETGYDTESCGLVYKDERGLYHISPDALVVGHKGGFETKDALPHIQIERHKYYRKHNKLEPTMAQQVQGSLFVTGYDWWDWQSYCITPDDSIPPLLIRVHPDDKFLKKFEVAIESFCDKLIKMISDVKNGS